MSSNKKKILTLKMKYEILCQLDTGVKQADLARKYDVYPSIISSLKRNRVKIFDAVLTRPMNTKKIKNTPFEQIDAELLNWFRHQRSNNVSISSQLLLEKAVKLADKLEVKNFKCNVSWIERFRKRHSITFGIVSGESKAVDQSVVERWLVEHWPQIRFGYEDRDIFNGDETGLFFKMLPNKTMKFRGDKCTGSKISKERLTVFLCASITGEKRPPIVIGKYLKPRCFKNKNLEHFNYYANRNAWMTAEIFKNELMKWDMKLRNKKRKVLLLIDNCSAHPDINNILTNIKTVFLPANTTSVLQPMDAGIIKNFKVNYRKSLVIQLINCIDQNQKYNVNIFDAILMISDAWERIAIETIYNCFHHAILKWQLNVTKTLMDMDVAVEEKIINETNVIVEFFESKRALDDYLAIDNGLEVTGTDESIEEICDSSRIAEMESLEIENEIKINEVFNAIKIVKEYYFREKSNDKIYTDLLNIENDLRNKFLMKKAIQKKITEYFNFK